MTITGSRLIAIAVLAPFFAYFFLRLIQYFLFPALGKKVPVDKEMLARGESVLLGQALRQAFAWSTEPLCRLLERVRIKPNTLTLLSFAAAVAAGVLIALGEVALGGALALAGSSLDYFDGRVARRTGRTSKAGAFLDSTLDRYSDVALLSGAAVLFRDTVPVLVACLVGMGSTVAISYTRAKVESLGGELKVGLMQRAERVVLFCVGALASPFVDPLLAADRQGRHLFFAGVLVLLAVLSAITTVHRTVIGFRRLELQDR
jgi:phosphatidylinositol phosphate synthase